MFLFVCHNIVIVLNYFMYSIFLINFVNNYTKQL